jgi:RCC1 and BTB domain-containing protein
LEVYTWGRGEDGQLGVGDTSDQYKPVIVDAFQSLNIVIDTIACGSGHSVVLSTSGSVYSWGRGDDGRLGHGDNGWKYIPRVVSTLKGKSIRIITCGSYHTAAVEEGGKLFTWGGGMYGKLGHGSEDGCSRPRYVDLLSSFHVSDIACGSRHTAVVMEDGQVWSWGDKENGVSGHGDTEGHQYTPKKVKNLGGVAASGISGAWPCWVGTRVVGGSC